MGIEVVVFGQRLKLEEGKRFDLNSRKDMGNVSTASFLTVKEPWEDSLNAAFADDKQEAWN